MKLRLLVAALLFAICASALAGEPVKPAMPATASPVDAERAQARAWTREVEAAPLAGDERKVIELTRQLEQAPLAAAGKDSRAWLIGWITRAPELQINLCDTLQVMKRDREYAWTSKLVVQTMFGMAAWELEHPNSKGMDVEVQLAGVRSALKAYQSILREHPDAKFAPMETLAAHEAAGDLPAHMKGVVAAECRA